MANWVHWPLQESRHILVHSRYLSCFAHNSVDNQHSNRNEQPAHLEYHGANAFSHPWHLDVTNIDCGPRKTTLAGPAQYCRIARGVPHPNQDKWDLFFDPEAGHRKRSLGHHGDYSHKLGPSSACALMRNLTAQLYTPIICAANIDWSASRVLHCSSHDLAFSSVRECHTRHRSYLSPLSSPTRCGGFSTSPRSLSAPSPLAIATSASALSARHAANRIRRRGDAWCRVRGYSLARSI
jgi:hypothetical protein